MLRCKLSRCARRFAAPGLAALLLAGCVAKTPPAATLYVTPDFVRKNPNTTQALVNAFVRALKWMHSHTAEEIVKVMPEEYALGDVALYTQAIKNDLPIFSPDGRFSREGAETAYKVLKAFDPAVAGAKIDLGATYTQDFVEKANAAQK